MIITLDYKRSPAKVNRYLREGKKRSGFKEIFSAQGAPENTPHTCIFALCMLYWSHKKAKERNALKRTILLASGSPRRRELLQNAGIDFIVDAANADENFSGGAEETVLTLSRRKAEAAAAKHPGETVLAADTIVYHDGRVLGKPADADEAKRMLRGLSDGWHEVYTGVTVIQNGETASRCAMTRVHFVPLTDAQIDAYVATGEPMDKAGAYGIQGGAARFVDRIEGSPTNVIGLPMELACSMLGL